MKGKQCMNKKELSERDICAKYGTPAVKEAGWDEMLQIVGRGTRVRGRDSPCYP
jgi:type I restriction enzyme R subunit